MVNETDRKTTADAAGQAAPPEGVANMAEMNMHMLEAFGDMGAEMARFMAQRIQEDVKVQQDLLHSKSLGEIQDIQLNFFEEAFKQYQEGAAHLYSIATHAMEDSKQDDSRTRNLSALPVGRVGGDPAAQSCENGFRRRALK